MKGVQLGFGMFSRHPIQDWLGWLLVVPKSTKSLWSGGAHYLITLPVLCSVVQCSVL
jgi:hypothetical protein